MIKSKSRPPAIAPLSQLSLPSRPSRLNRSPLLSTPSGLTRSSRLTQPSRVPPLFLLPLLFFLLAYLPSFSQEAYQQGGSTVNAGIGIGTPYWGKGFSSSFPVSPTVSYEYGFTDQVSGGAVLGYSGAKISTGSASIKYSGVLIGARGSYHFLTTDQWDPYVTATLGYISVSVNDNSNGAHSAKGSGLGAGLQLGARYFFQPDFGVYAELGYSSFSILNLGVALKF